MLECAQPLLRRLPGSHHQVPTESLGGQLLFLGFKTRPRKHPSSGHCPGTASGMPPALPGSDSLLSADGKRTGFAQGHIARQWQRHGMNQGCQLPKSIISHTMLLSEL